MGKKTVSGRRAHGTLAVAEFQSAGKGRLGRRWQAPEGSSVMMSLLLKPEFEPGYASMLTVVMGLSVAQAMQKTGIEVSIKWPNDVVMSRRKICGILTEMGLNGTKIREVVIGVGISVNLKEIPSELRTKRLLFIWKPERHMTGFRFWLRCWNVLKKIMRRLSGPAAFPEWWKNIISFWQTGISLSVFLIRISPGRERPWELMNRESFW